VDPVACTPASGGGGGQVENQVGVVRERFEPRRVCRRLFGVSQAARAVTSWAA
jgi:hypothetical protein